MSLPQTGKFLTALPLNPLVSLHLLACWTLCALASWLMLLSCWTLKLQALYETVRGKRQLSKGIATFLHPSLPSTNAQTGSCTHTGHTTDQFCSVS